MKGRDGGVNGRYEKVRTQDNRRETGNDKTRVRDLWAKGVVNGKGLNHEICERSAHP